MPGNKASTRGAALTPRRPDRRRCAVGRYDDRRGRELTDRDVIGMAVSAVRTERHDDIRTDSSQVLERSARSLHVGRRDRADRPDTRARNFTDAEHRRRRLELGLSNRSKRRCPWVVRVAPAAILTAFTLRRGDEKRLDAAAAYFAKLPPNPRDSSSGCASTAIRRRLLAIVSTAHRGNALQLLSNAA